MDKICTVINKLADRDAANADTLRLLTFQALTNEALGGPTSATSLAMLGEYVNQLPESDDRDEAVTLVTERMLRSAQRTMSLAMLDL